MATSLKSGNVVLTFPTVASGGFGITLHDSAAGGSDAYSAQPAQILVCASCTAANQNSDLPFTGSSYASVTQDDSSVTATASVTAPSGSVFRVVDIYTAMADGLFKMRRTVTVTTAAPGDSGFNSKFGIGFQTPVSLSQYHVFAPGIWYDHNANSAQSGAFGTDTLNENFYWRETRSTLPLVALQDPGSGSTLSLAHINSTPAPGASNDDTGWVVDPFVQYGSIGLQQRPRVDLGFIYPASEGDGSYVGGGAKKAYLSSGAASTVWVRRSHPVTVNFAQNYTLTLGLQPFAAQGGGADFQAAMARIWEIFYALFDLPTADIPGATVFTDGINLLNRYVETVNGATGLPFDRPIIPNLPTGDNAVYEMGFVGQQIPLGFQLLRDGVLNHRSSGASYANGLAILNFWANNAAQPSGLPLTNYNATAKAFQNVDGKCPLAIFTRVASDGMEGMVLAAIFMRQHGQPQPAWEKFAQGYGDWLVSHQNADGSFYRAYNPDGSVYTNPCIATAYGSSKFSTTMPIRTLVELYFATGSTKYLDAAKKAGQYSLTNIYNPVQYIGGVVDNPDVIDKESGIIAMHAALALLDAAIAQNDAAGQATWLAAARQAANYTRTWGYGWSFPIGLAPGVSATGNAYPAYQATGTRAIGLIALGQSSADISLSYESYDFFRIHLFVGGGADDVYLTTANHLFNDTKLTTQLTGIPAQQYGYTYNGLLGEAVDLSSQLYGGGMSSFAWLPWLTNAEIDPIQRLRDTFKSGSIADAGKQGADTLMAQNRAVYPAPGSINWGR